MICGLVGGRPVGLPQLKGLVTSGAVTCGSGRNLARLILMHHIVRQT